MKILIIEDERLLAGSIKDLLEIQGFEAEAVYDGETGFTYAGTGIYDLIILDVMMPGLNGYQTCMEIRKKSNVPILFLSARTQVEDKIMGFSSGGDDYLPKPFSYQELISRVKALVRRYHRKKKCAAELWKCIRKPELYGKTEKRFL